MWCYEEKRGAAKKQVNIKNKTQCVLILHNLLFHFDHLFLTHFSSLFTFLVFSDEIFFL